MRIGDRVRLTGEAGHCGAIVGTAWHQHDDGTIRTLYVVQLDVGFYDPTKSMFIRLTVAHPDNVSAE